MRTEVNFYIGDDDGEKMRLSCTSSYQRKWYVIRELRRIGTLNAIVINKGAV